MKDMGRPKSVHRDLPPRMIPRVYPSGVIAYYYNGKKRIPLGRDLAKAKLKWAELDGAPASVGTFRAVADDWKKRELCKRGVYTQLQYEKYLSEILPAFGSGPMDEIGTEHCQQYLERRTAKVKANREVSLLSTIWNWARRTGRTRAPNPVPGIERNREVPRGRYVHDSEFRIAYESEHAPTWYQDAIDILKLAGQRPGDTLAMMWKHEIDGCIWVTQEKTGAKVRIVIEGELQEVLERIRARPRKVKSLYIVADERGQRITVDRLQKVHIRARGEMDWQIRDIRKKTGTDVEDIRHAQRLLGHASEVTTARHYRTVKGNRVKPLR
jgi:integrase